MKNSTTNKITLLVVCAILLLLTNFRVGASSKTNALTENTFILDNNYLSTADYTEVLRFEGSETAVTAPTATTASKIDRTSFQANWSSVKGVDGYQLYVYTVGSLQTRYVTGYNPKLVAGAATVKATVSGLNMNTTYYFVLKAVVGKIESDLSNVIKVTTLNTLPAAPVVTEATDITSSSFTFSWNEADGATSYKVYVTDESTEWYVDGYKGKPVTGTSCVVSELKDNNQYRYLVVAVNAAGDSPFSNSPDVVTKCVAPVATAATDITTTSFKANWEKDEAYSYELYLYTQEIKFPFTKTYVPGYPKYFTAPTTNATISGLTEGKTYYFVLKGRGSLGGSTSDLSNIIKVTTLTAPVTTAATNITSSSFKANWEEVENADSYALYVYQKSLNPSTGDFEKVYVTGYSEKQIHPTATSETVSGLTDGTTYYYTLKTVDNNHDFSDFSNEITVKTLEVAPDAPVATAATDITPTSFTANWNIVKDVDGYLLYVYTVGLGFNKIYVDNYNPKGVPGSKSLKTTVSGLAKGTTYYYVVKAVVGTNESDLSNVITLKTMDSAPDAPVATAASNITTTSFQANWKSTEGASAYKLYVLREIAGQPGFYSLIDGYDAKKITGTSFVLPENTLEPGVNYVYFLRATNSVGDSPESNSISLTTNPLYTLSLSASPVAGGTVNGEDTYTPGTSVTAQATASDGYTFVNWTEGGAEVSTNAAYTFTLNEDRTLVANFRLTTSIDDKDAAHINVWPNPALETINISEIPNGSSLKISSLPGQVIIRKNDCNTLETINIEALKNGIYILMIENKDIRYLKKIIKK